MRVGTICPGLGLRLERVANKHQSKTNLMAFLLGAWLIDVTWLVASFALITLHSSLGLFVILSTLGFAVCLAFMTKRILTQWKCDDFSLNVDDEGVHLISREGVRHHEVQSMEWNDVRWAEVYRFSDKACIVLRGRSDTLLISTMAIQERSGDFVEALKSRYVPMVFVPDR